MTVGEFIKQATDKLSGSGIESPRLDCLLLLEDALDRQRASLLAHPETILGPETEVELNTKVAQRATHLPLAYIRKKAEFYGRTFIVNQHTLVPRPESEAIIEVLKGYDLPTNPRIIDLGTGSGCLGITAALEIAGSSVLLSDIDKNALQIAKQNSDIQHAKVTLAESNLLAKISSPLDVILANLPYVPISYPINQAAQHEPKVALFAGEDGLDLYRQLWQQITLLSHSPKFVITESLSSQHQALEKLAQKSGYELSESSGLAQCFRPIQSAPRLA